MWDSCSVKRAEVSISRKFPSFKRVIGGVGKWNLITIYREGWQTPILLATYWHYFYAPLFSPQPLGMLFRFGRRSQDPLKWTVLHSYSLDSHDLESLITLLEQIQKIRTSQEVISSFFLRVQFLLYTAGSLKVSCSVPFNYESIHRDHQRLLWPKLGQEEPWEPSSSVISNWTHKCTSLGWCPILVGPEGRKSEPLDWETLRDLWK